MLSTFHITSMTLRTIYVCCWCGRKTSQDVYHGMVIEDTPALERFAASPFPLQGKTNTCSRGSSGQPRNSSPLDLIDTHELCHGYRKSSDAFSKILGNHLGPTRGLRMGKFRSNGRDRAKLDDWFGSPALDQLEELTFDDGHMRSLPTSALRLAPTLRVAKFRNCHPSLNDAPALFLPRLKLLELIVVCLLNGDMERLLHGCTALEFLHLQVTNWSSTLHITSRTLQTIYVCCWCCNERSQKVDHNMVIEDTPSLERLLVVYQEGPARISVISAPKLTVVGYSSGKYS